MDEFDLAYSPPLSVLDPLESSVESEPGTQHTSSKISFIEEVVIQATQSSDDSLGTLLASVRDDDVLDEERSIAAWMDLALGKDIGTQTEQAEGSS